MQSVDIIKHNLSYYLKPTFMLILGCGIYFIFRSHSLCVYSWVSSIGLGLPYSNMHITGDSTIINWFIYSLPDGLWLYSLFLFMNIIWKDSGLIIKQVVFICISVIAIGHEVGQGIHLFRGTFDIGDMIAYILAASVAYKSIKGGSMVG